MLTEFTTIELKKPDDEFWELLESFKHRAGDLYEYRKSVNWGRITTHIGIHSDKPSIKGDLPGRIKLEALYMRYRLFILNNEKSNYRRFLNKLSGVARNEFVTLYVKYAQKEFFKCLVIDTAFIKANKKYTSEQIIDLWFNAHYFHSDDSKDIKLKELVSILSKEGAEVSLFHAVFDSCNEIRSTSYLVSETTQINPKVKIPVLYQWAPNGI